MVKRKHQQLKPPLRVLIHRDFIKSLSSNNIQLTNVLRVVKNSIDKWRRLPDNLGKDIDDKSLISIVLDEVSKRREVLLYLSPKSTVMYSTDMLDKMASQKHKVEKEIDILSQYLPKQLTDIEINDILKECMVTFSNRDNVIYLVNRFFHTMYYGRYEFRRLNLLINSYLTELKEE